MRILYFSDIHTEIRYGETRPYPGWIEANPLSLGPDLTKFRGEVDLLILAGDIGRGNPSEYTSATRYAEQAAEYLGVSAILVPGNHEYYGADFDKMRQMLIGASTDRVRVLDRGTVVSDDGSVRILGATLWTDYALNGSQETSMEIARHKISDHRVITRSGGGAFKPEDALREHRKSREWLLQQIKSPFEGQTIVVTHHVPHPSARNLSFGDADPLAPTFVSDCSDLISIGSRRGVSAWIYGHHHMNQDIEVSGMALLSRQLGYPRERIDWAGPGILDL
jgi:predicted phosphohydrolase